MDLIIVTGILCMTAIVGIFKVCHTFTAYYLSKTHLEQFKREAEEFCEDGRKMYSQYSEESKDRINGIQSKIDALLMNVNMNSHE